MNVPFVDLKAQYQSIKKVIDPAIQGVLDETAFIGGDRVEKFEKEFAEFVGVANVKEMRLLCRPTPGFRRQALWSG